MKPNMDVEAVHWRNRQHAADLNVVTLEPSNGWLLPPPESMESQRARYMSEEALALKRKTPMFTK